MAPMGESCLFARDNKTTGGIYFKPQICGSVKGPIFSSEVREVDGLGAHMFFVPHPKHQI